MKVTRWSRSLGAVFLCVLVALCALTGAARGAVDVQIANNTQVASRLVTPDGRQRFRVLLPEGAKFTVSVKGKKDKKAGVAAPTMRLRFLDEFEDELIVSGFLAKAKVKVKGVGAKAKATIEDSGEYVVEVFSDDDSVGAFTVSVKWSSPRAARIKDEVFFAGDETGVDVAVDAGARLTMTVKKSGKSTARPFFDRIEGDELDQELDNAAKLKKITVIEGGDLFIVIGNESGDGAIAGSVKIKPPRTRKVKVSIAPVGAGAKSLVGKVATPSRELLFSIDDADLVGDALVGSSLFVPVGALTQPSSVQIGSADPLLAPAPEAGAGAGPTVFFGPAGLTFETPVTITIPFDVAALDGGDIGDLSVFTEDEDGNVTEITEFDVDLVDGAVSFQVSHFSTFRVFAAGLEPGRLDLDGDQVDDVVLLAPAVGDGAGRVYVFSGVPGFDGDTSEADHTIAGLGVAEQFGQAFAVGDVTGDGQADLVVLGDGVVDGTCYVFAGGVTFRPSDRDDAAFRLDGAVGFSGMTSVAVGDVNGDGVADIAVGGESGPTGEGVAVVWFGGSELRSETTSGADLTFSGEQVGDLFGAAVQIGDVNGDGQPDLVVGADMIDTPGRKGAVYVQFGSSGIAGAAAESMDVVIGGSAADAGFGLNIAIGDVTNDGDDDLVVSEFDDDLGGPGAVFVFRGGTGFASGDTSAAAAVFRGAEDETLGSAVRLADVTGDGVLDLVLGARDAAAGDGGIFVFDGGPSIVGQNVRIGLPDISGPGFFEGFPRLAQPIRSAGRAVITAFAPGNEDGDVDAGAAYLFVGDPRGQQQGLTTDDADITIFGQAGDSLGGELF